MAHCKLFTTVFFLIRTSCVGSTWASRFYRPSSRTAIAGNAPMGGARSRFVEEDARKSHKLVISQPRYPHPIPKQTGGKERSTTQALQKPVKAQRKKENHHRNSCVPSAHFTPYSPQGQPLALGFGISSSCCSSASSPIAGSAKQY